MLWLSLLLPRVKKILSKFKALEWPQYKILILKHSRAANSAVIYQIRLKFELIRAVINVLVTSRNEEDRIKLEGARVATTLNIDFSNTQGHLNPRSRVGSGWNLNSSKMLWLSLLLPKMKKIRSKLKALSWPQH